MNSALSNEPGRREVALPKAEAAGKPVYIIDSDPMLRSTLNTVLARAGYVVQVFASAEMFLASLDDKSGGVLVADLQIKRMSGLALQAEINQRHANLPMIFMTARNHLKNCVTAMKEGAVDILEKPVNTSELLVDVQAAFVRAENEEKTRRRRADIRSRCARLTPREREVMLFIVGGLANRKIAQCIGVSSRTVEVHRARVMEKMRADTLPDLVRQVELCRQCSSCAAGSALPAHQR